MPSLLSGSESVGGVGGGNNSSSGERRPSIKKAKTPDHEPDLKVVKGADQLLPKAATLSTSSGSQGSQKKKSKKKKPPCLTIKIQNSSVHADDEADEADDFSDLGPSVQKELSLSPNFIISGVSIRRQSPGALSAVSSPGRPPGGGGGYSCHQQANTLIQGQQQGEPNRNRSSSLVVQTLTASSSHSSVSRSPRSPGSKSLHVQVGSLKAESNFWQRRNQSFLLDFSFSEPFTG